MARLAIYNSNLVQLAGSPSTIAIGSGQLANAIHVGQHHGINQPASISYYNDMIFAYGANAVFPLLPPAANVPPSIATQPQNTTVTASQTATFTVVASGTSPFTYQWRWYGTNVAGATGSSWTTPVLAVGHSGSQVSVVVNNAFGPATSSTVTLTVNAGSAPVVTELGLADDANTLPTNGFQVGGLAWSRLEMGLIQARCV